MLRIVRSSLGQIRDFGFVAIFFVATSCLSHPPAGQEQFNTAQGSAATTVFDGKYVGAATTMSGEDPVDCYPTTSMDMAIAGGQVLIHADYAKSPFAYSDVPPKMTFQGSVNPAGEVSALGSFPGTVRMVTGTIRDKVFHGQRLAGKQCHYTVEMVKQ